jgi:DNA-binding transcriptional LysR family regulator
MSLFSYQVFDTVAKHKSLVRAAEVLNLTPSAVSHSLTKLEKEFGFPLMVRDRNGCILTTNGEHLLSYARNVLALDNKLREEINMLNGLEKGIVNLGTFNSVCCCWLPDIIKEFNEKYPGIDVRVFQGGYMDMENWLQSTKIDIAFVSMATSSTLSVTPLIQDRMLCITPTTFKPINTGYVTIDELHEQRFIFPEEGYADDIKLFFNANSLSTCHHHNIKDDSSIVALVESGLGFSIIPELVLKKVIGNINIYPIETEPFRTIGIAIQNEQFLTLAAKALFDEIRTYINNTYVI